jgi:hypothetical protein
MIVGSKQQLAIEFEIVPSTGDVILLRFCLWAADRMIGNFGEVIVLTAVQAQIERLLHINLPRTDPELSTASKVNAMETLREALYGEGGDLQESTRLALKYGRFNLKEIGISSFDELFIFLIDAEDRQRLIWQGTAEDEVYEAVFAKGAFERVAQEFLDLLKGQISKQ